MIRSHANPSRSGHRIRIFVLIAATAVYNAAPAAAEVDQDGGGWIIFVSSGDFGGVSPKLERLKYWVDSQVRLLESTSGYSQALVRPGLGWGIFDHGAIWAGYNYVNTQPVTGPSTDEHQAWQQFTWSEPTGPWSRLWRTRLEQRFSSSGDDVGVRLRQLFKATIPIRKGSRVSVAGWDEVFFHLRDTDWGNDAGFDENRFFIGVAWKLPSKFGTTMEVGYMNRYIDKSTGPNRLEHIVSTTFAFN